ncbi:MAG TPA: MCP four helix bundle domain-containing protein, partial [Spirochaetota bacterium]|nr:MCP four helix bundle domain-containing protein [Spirochaetota bacterium]
MKGPKKTSLARKFIGIYLVLIASIVFVGVISFSHLSSIEKILSEDVIKKAEARYVCKNIILQSINIFGQVEEYSYEQDPNRKRATKMIIYDTIRLIREYEAQIKRMTLTPAESKLLDRIDSILKNYYAQIDRIFSFFAVNHRRPNADYTIIDEFNDTHALLVTKLLELEKNETVLMHEAQDNAKKTIRNFKIQIFIFCVAFTITAFALSLFRTRSVTRPINSLVSVLEKYGKGDTGVRARIDTWDEIGFLASR